MALRDQIEWLVVVGADAATIGAIRGPLGELDQAVDPGARRDRLTVWLALGVAQAVDLGWLVRLLRVLRLDGRPSSSITKSLPLAPRPARRRDPRQAKRRAAR